MKNITKKHKNSLAVKLGVFLVSLSVCLAVLECGLRLAGYAVTASRTSAFLPPYEDATTDSDYIFERYRSGNARDRLVLTLGDSLTNAGNVKSYHSYPYYLYRRFVDGGTRAAVYNMAKCEESTFGAAAKLGKYLRTRPPDQAPDTVVILVGAADLFNLPLVKKKMESDDASWKDMLPGGGLYSLRLYKVYRHIKMNLTFKSGPDGDDEGGASMEERLGTLLEVYEEHAKSLGADRRKPLDGKLVDKVYRVFSREEAEHDDLDLNRAADFMSFLADYASVVYTPQVRYDKFFALLLDMAEKFPADFWTPEFDTAGYYFVQIYQVQSRFTAQDVLKVLDEGLAAHPELRENDSFANFRKYLTEREAMDRYVDKRRMEAWDEIVRLSREKNIRLVLQNYPVEYKSANRVLEEVAAKYKLPLVDNRKHFAALIRKEGREAYLEDNDHLTPAGYEILAANVYGVLAAEDGARTRIQ